MTRAILAALVGIALVGCGGSGAKEEADEVASIDFNLAIPAEFVGNSVKVCGKRLAKADGKYRCMSSLGEADYSHGIESHCICLDFNELGSLPTIEDLCPSKDVPVADWEFTFEVFSGECVNGEPTGEALNPLNPLPGEGHNFACFDTKHNGFEVPDRTIEPLVPGCNTNEITCITRSAQKLFDFDVCVLVEPPCRPDADGIIVGPLCEPLCDYDGVCDEGETCENCRYHDNCCVPPPTCDYDGVCDQGETCALCPFHDNCCPPVCGDGVCASTEDCFNCPQDCGGECFELDCGCRAVDVEPDSLIGDDGMQRCVCPETVEAPEDCRLGTPEEGCNVICRGTRPTIDP